MKNLAASTILVNSTWKDWILSIQPYSDDRGDPFQSHFDLDILETLNIQKNFKDYKLS